MSDPILLGLSGSLRREATNRKLLNAAARLFGPAQYSQGDLRLDLYDGDAENDFGIPENVQTLADQIAAADAVIISTPEYNSAPSGVLKNALDWVSRTSGKPWLGKPVAVMSAAAGRSGGERSQSILRACLLPFQARVIPGPQLHLAGSGKAFDENGLLVSEQYQRTLQRLMQALRDEIGR